MNKLFYRVIDANFNRAREGLRVCEEFVRFFLNDKELTEDVKKIRSSVAGIYKDFSEKKRLLFTARDVAGDVGKAGFGYEKKRRGLLDIFWSNIQRSKEAFRVLEEFSRLEKKGLSDEFRRLRFKTYAFEKEAFTKLQALFGSGQGRRRKKGPG